MSDDSSKARKGRPFFSPFDERVIAMVIENMRKRSKGRKKKTRGSS